MAKSTTKKNEFKEFDFNADNGNIFSGRLWPKSGGSEKADIYPLSLTVNGLAIVGAKLVDGKNGSFISFPQYKTTKGEYKAQCYFYNKDDMADCSQFADYLVKLLAD